LVDAQQAPVEPAASRKVPLPTELRGRWLKLARTAWVAATALIVGPFIVSVPPGFEYLGTACTGIECDGPQLSPENARALQNLGLSLDFYAAYFGALIVGFAAVFFAVAAIIFWRRSDDWMALYVSFFLVMLGAVSPPTLDVLAEVYPAWRLPVRLATVLMVASLFLFFFLFPNGRFVPRWTRWAATIGAMLVAPVVFFPTLDTRHPVLLASYLLIFIGICVFAQVHRYRRVSGPLERQQTKWAVFGTATALAGFLGLVAFGLLVEALGRPQPGPLAKLAFDSAIYLFMLLIPHSIGFAILRYRLWDIDLIVNRTLVYGVLTVCVVGLYVLVIGYLGALVRTGSNLAISLVATGIVAVLFAPLRERLQRGVNRLMYGERDDPYGVLSRLGQRLRGTRAPETVLPTIVETVAGALKLPYAAVALKHDDGFETVAEYGCPTTGEPLVLPLSYGTETIGQLILTPRAPGEPFGPTDKRLLDDLARHAEAAAYAVRLTADLQRSRERLVNAREEERRRLRRDLHDGLGPQLATLTLKLDAARNLLASQPGATDTLLAELKAQTQAAISDIRRLVYDLRPPALDELGLVPVIREQATNYSQNGLNVSVEAPEHLPPLPAAAEVAAYRIAQEALTNVSRHARARTCRIRLSVSDELQLEIADDGIGLPEDRHAGVGLSSMHERAAELGGTCEVAPITRRWHARARAPASARSWGEAVTPIRILVADDHALFRDGLRALFLSLPDTEVAGEAATGEEAVARAAELGPDVVLMDIQMPSTNGIEATRTIVRDSPHIGVVVVTMFEDDDSVFAAMRAGARGYVLKGADQDEILKVIRAVAGGEAHFGPEIAHRLMGFLSAPRPTAPAEAFPELTTREHEVLDLIAKGRTNQEIAKELYLSPKTVRNHISNIFTKLQVADRAQAIIRAREAGLG